MFVAKGRLLGGPGAEDLARLPTGLGERELLKAGTDGLPDPLDGCQTHPHEYFNSWILPTFLAIIHLNVLDLSLTSLGTSSVGKTCVQVNWHTPSPYHLQKKENKKKQTPNPLLPAGAENPAKKKTQTYMPMAKGLSSQMSSFKRSDLANILSR